MGCDPRCGRHSSAPGAWICRKLKLEGDSRIVTFANGIVVRELIVDVGSARSEPLTHHNASIQVFSEGDEKCRVVWIADLMPNEVAGSIGEMIQEGLNTMKQTLQQ